MKQFLYYISIVSTFCLFSYSSQAQILTAEDSLTAGIKSKGDRATVISGYGEASYTQDLVNNTGTARLNRAVLFVGHRFSDKISLFTELEIEDAVVAGDKSGEISMEQAFLKFDLNKNTYLTAGLFVPRIGIINENHLPTTFNGMERPYVEQMVIPATWREIGVGIYGSFKHISGLNYSAAIMNGLNAEGFSMDQGLREGRAEGFTTGARSKAVTASLLYYYGPFRIQASSYMGGSVGVDNRTADRLELHTGAFGTPVFLNEANIQYRSNGLTLKAIACMVNIPDASSINKAYPDNNTPKQMMGAYGEIGYNLLQKKSQTQQFIVFSRYEYINMEAQLPENGIKNDAFKQSHIISGITYLPVRGVAIKADFQYTTTGDFNPLLISNPDPFAPAYQPVKKLVHLGIGYSF